MLLVFSLFGCGEKATVTEKGIEYEGLYYTCEEAEQEFWFAKAKATGRWKLPITYDPSSVEHIFICKDEKKLIKCDLLSRSVGYAAANKEEMKRYKESDANEKAKYSQTLERAKNKLIKKK